MKKSIPFLLILLTPLFSGGQQLSPSKLPKTGDVAPAFNFYISKIRKANLSDYKGKIVMIGFFATWCGPCRSEMNRVQDEIWEKYKDNPKFALFFFGYDQGWDLIQPFKDKIGYTFLLLPDEGRRIFTRFASDTIPRTFLLDESQKIIFKSTGYDPNSLKMVQKILDQKLN